MDSSEFPLTPALSLQGLRTRHFCAGEAKGRCRQWACQPTPACGHPSQEGMKTAPLPSHFPNCRAMRRGRGRGDKSCGRARARAEKGAAPAVPTPPHRMDSSEFPLTPALSLQGLRTRHFCAGEAKGRCRQWACQPTPACGHPSEEGKHRPPSPPRRGPAKQGGGLSQTASYRNAQHTFPGGDEDLPPPVPFPKLSCPEPSRGEGARRPPQLPPSGVRFPRPPERGAA